MKSLKIALASTLLAASASSMAGPITVDGGWYGFCFDAGVGQPAFAGGCQNLGSGESGNPFTFTLTGPGLLKVTDAFIIGDSFSVFVNSVLAFTTSGDGLGAGTADPDIAFSGGHYSSGSLLLGAGAYSVEVFTASTPGGGGGGYLEVESVRNNVPEPGALALVGLALAGLGWSRRSKKA